MTKDKKIENQNSQIVIYKDQNGNIKIDVRFDGDTVWLTQKMIALLFQVSIPTVNEHIKNIINEREVDGVATIRKFRIVQNEGKRKVERGIEYYSLDFILSVGYRVKSSQGTAFRKWAAEIVIERVDLGKQNLGLTNFRGIKPTREEVIIAKNYYNIENNLCLNIITQTTNETYMIQTRTGGK